MLLHLVKSDQRGIFAGLHENSAAFSDVHDLSSLHVYELLRAILGKTLGDALVRQLGLVGVLASMDLMLVLGVTRRVVVAATSVALLAADV